MIIITNISNKVLILFNNIQLLVLIKMARFIILGKTRNHTKTETYIF